MRQIDGPTAVNPKPTPFAINGPGWFNHANPRVSGQGVPTILTSDFLNALQDEIISLLSYVGFTMDWTDNHQILDAILALIKAGGGGTTIITGGDTIFFAATDTGPANNITISIPAITGTPPVGTTVAIYMGHANTGATTINLNGLGAQVAANLGGAQLFNNQLQANSVSLFTKHGTGWFLLSPSFWQPTPLAVAPTVNGSGDGGSLILEPFGGATGALILNKAGKLMFSNASGGNEVELDLNTGQMNTNMIFCKTLGKYLTPGFNNSFTWTPNAGEQTHTFNFVIPNFTYQIQFQVTGGGGAGGSCDFNHVGSGGGGGETVMQIWACQPGDQVTIVCGGQGQQQGILNDFAPASDQGFGAGWSSSVTLVTGGVTKIITAGGGSGGNSFLANQNQPGAYGSLIGGVTASNAWLVSGGFGGDSYWMNGPGTQIAGHGGGTLWGPGGGGLDHGGFYAQQDNQNTGFPGTVNLAAQGHGPVYGTGGGGAVNFAGLTTGLGGIGGTGIVLALW